MLKAKPLSLKIFTATIAITCAVFISASFLSYYKADKKYSMLLVTFQFLSMAFTPIGVYAGLKFKSQLRNEILLNRVGIVGNLIIFLFTVGLMFYAAVMHAAN